MLMVRLKDKFFNLNRWNIGISAILVKQVIPPTAIYLLTSLYSVETIKVGLGSHMTGLEGGVSETKVPMAFAVVPEIIIIVTIIILP